MSVRCGNKIHQHFAVELEGMAHHHDSVAQVRLCYSREDGIRSHEEIGQLEEWAAQQAGELWAESAWLRHAENAGWEDAEFDRQMEDARGVVQFEDAYAAAQDDVR